MSGTSISVWRRYANAMVLLLNVIVGTALVVTAYSGYESPVDTPIMGVIILSFPAWLALSVFLLVADMIWWHKTALVPVAAILASWPTVWASCPLNIGGGIPHGTPSERVFTLLTYNVNNLRDVKDNYPGGVNPILSEILRIDADIACVQELKILECNRDFAITQAQIDSLHARYPFVTLNGHAMAIFSKYPVTPLHLEKPKRERDNFADISGYVAEVEGHRLAIFSVHMQSFRLTREDKAAYRDLTRLRSDESIDDLRNTLLEKETVVVVGVRRTESHFGPHLFQPLVGKHMESIAPGHIVEIAAHHHILAAIILDVAAKVRRLHGTAHGREFEFVEQRIAQIVYAFVGAQTCEVGRGRR